MPPRGRSTTSTESPLSSTAYLGTFATAISIWSISLRLDAPAAPDAAALAARCALFKDRAATLEELAELLLVFELEPAALNRNLTDELAAQVRPEALPALASLADRLAACAWDKAGIAAALKDTLAAHQLKMPQLAVPVRLKVFGRAQTPSLDAMLSLMPRETVVDRLRA